jgi:hypothetical protein
LRRRADLERQPAACALTMISRDGRVVSRAIGRTLSGSSAEKSKARTSRARISALSMVAKAAPTQTRGPIPKGR